MIRLKKPIPKQSKTKPVALGAGAVGLALLLGCWLVGCGNPPQMGADEKVFATVDALFTAVTAHDETGDDRYRWLNHALVIGKGELIDGCLVYDFQQVV